MKERPILFSAPMVRAILAGPKSQTRRVCKGQRELSNIHDFRLDNCPYGQPGDRLWVRETWRQAYAKTSYSEGVVYRADAARALGMDEYSDRHTWKPSIFMPRRYSRITLEVTGVRVERLQEISPADVAAEGVTIPVDAQSGRTMLEFGGKFSPANYLPKPDTRVIKLQARRVGKRSEFNFHMARAHYASLWESINGPGSWDANPWVWVVEFKRIEATP